MIKVKGMRWYNFQNIVKVYGKDINQVKELGFIMLQGLLTDNENEKQILKNIYKSTVKNI